MPTIDSGPNRYKAIYDVSEQVQLHGDENSSDCFKIRIPGYNSTEMDTFWNNRNNQATQTKQKLIISLKIGSI